MHKRQKSNDNEMNTSNYCLFGDDSPKEENNNINQINFNQLDNPKTVIVKKKKNFNLNINEFQDIDIKLNNNNKDNNEDTFRNFKLFEDTNKGEKKINFDNNINNIDNNININNEINKRNSNRNINNINLNFNDDDEDYNQNNNKNIVNNNNNINNNFNKNIANINNIDKNNEINMNNEFFDSKNSKNLNINNINYMEENINNSSDEEKIESDKINKIKSNKINENNISNKKMINNPENKKNLNLNKKKKLELQNNINQKMDVDKIKQNFKIMKNKNNKLPKTFIFDSGQNPLNKKESEEERQKREMIEKERNGIRDKLVCYLCFGKIKKARLCLNCKKLACEDCVKNMLLKHAKCLNCKQPASLENIVLLPFMDDLTSFFINIENNQIKEKEKDIKQRNFIIDEDDDNNNNINNNYNKRNNINKEKEERIKKKCQTHPDKYIEYYCFQCKEYLCEKCLLIFKQSVIERHNNHTILPIVEFKKYNIKEAIDEYNKLNNSKKDIDNLLSECNLRIKKLTTKKEIALKNIEEAKKQFESKIIEKINILKDISTTLGNKKDTIENSIDSVPNSFSNLISQKDYNQGKQICKELKKLNAQLISIDDIKKKIEPKKNNICFETFESDIIDITLPQNGQYLEELKIYDNEIKIIPEHKSQFKIDLLGGNFIFTLMINIGNEYYEQYHPMFRGYFMVINTENRFEYANLIGSVYANGIQILTVELEYNNFIKIVGEKAKFKLICCVDKVYYK